MKPPRKAFVPFPGLFNEYGIPYRRQTIFRMRQDGTFPEPVQLSKGTIAWRTDDIEKWIASRPLAQVEPPAHKPKLLATHKPEPPVLKPKTTKHRATTVGRGVVTRKKRAAEIRPA